MRPTGTPVRVLLRRYLSTTKPRCILIPCPEVACTTHTDMYDTLAMHLSPFNSLVDVSPWRDIPRSVSHRKLEAPRCVEVQG